MSRALFALVVFLAGTQARAFPGLLIAPTGEVRAPMRIEVVYAAHGDERALTFRADVPPDLSRFLWLVAVPADAADAEIRTRPGHLLDRLAAFSAPRFIEAEALDPCAPDEGSAERPIHDARPRSRPRELGFEAPVEEDTAFVARSFFTDELGALETWIEGQGFPPLSSELAFVLGAMQGRFTVLALVVDDTHLERAPDGRARTVPAQLGFASGGTEIAWRPELLDAPAELVVYALSPSADLLPAGRTVVMLPNVIALLPSSPERAERALHLFGVRSVGRRELGAALLLFSGRTDVCRLCPVPPLRPFEVDGLGLGQKHGRLVRMHFLAPYKSAAPLSFEPSFARDVDVQVWALRRFEGEARCAYPSPRTSPPSITPIAIRSAFPAEDVGGGP